MTGAENDVSTLCRTIFKAKSVRFSYKAESIRLKISKQSDRLLNITLKYHENTNNYRIVTTTKCSKKIGLVVCGLKRKSLANYVKFCVANSDTV